MSRVGSHRLWVPVLPRFGRWVLVAAVMGLIFYYSVFTTPDSVIDVDKPWWDKDLHFLAYFGLTMTLAYATIEYRRHQLLRVLVVVGGALAFGIGIELLQAPMARRTASLGDFLANAIGTLVASGWFLAESRVSYVDLWPAEPDRFEWDT